MQRSCLVAILLTLSSILFAQQKKNGSPVQLRINNDCRFEIDDSDAFNGQRKRSLQPRFFFSFTPESYKRFFKEDDYLRCEGQLMERSGDYSLQLTITIQDKTAKSSFGEIAPMSKIFLYPIKGAPIALQSFRGSKITETPGFTTYTCSFALKKHHLKIVKKQEIDRIRINWSQGYQNYEIYYVDFLLDQFACFQP